MSTTVPQTGYLSRVHNWEKAISRDIHPRPHVPLEVLKRKRARDSVRTAGKVFALVNDQFFPSLPKVAHCKLGHDILHMHLAMPVSVEYVEDGLQQRVDTDKAHTECPRKELCPRDLAIVIPVQAVHDHVCMEVGHTALLQDVSQR